MTMDLFEARKRRDAALSLLETKRAEWLMIARAAAVTHAEIHGTVSSDDIWILKPPPVYIDPRAMGAVFSKRRGWVKVGYQQSARPQCHARPIAVWKLNPCPAS
jgi:hypothetical protein